MLEIRPPPPHLLPTALWSAPQRPEFSQSETPGRDAGKMRQFVYVFVCLSVCLFVCLSLCLACLLYVTVWTGVLVASQCCLWSTQAPCSVMSLQLTSVEQWNNGLGLEINSLQWGVVFLFIDWLVDQQESHWSTPVKIKKEKKCDLKDPEGMMMMMISIPTKSLP